MVRHCFYAVQSSYCLVGTAITLSGGRRVQKKKAVGYSFVIKSIISKGGAVKLFTAHKRNIFPSFLIENSFYHRIKFHFKVSSNIVQCDINAQALYRQFEKLRVIFFTVFSMVCLIFFFNFSF